VLTTVLSVHALSYLCPQKCCYCKVITSSAANSIAVGSDCCLLLLLHFGLVNTHWVPLHFAVLAKATLSLSLFDCPVWGPHKGTSSCSLHFVRAVLLDGCTYQCCCSTHTVHCSWCWHCPHNGSCLLFSLVHSVHSGQTVLFFQFAFVVSLNLQWEFMVASVLFFWTCSSLSLLVSCCCCTRITCMCNGLDASYTCCTCCSFVLAVLIRLQYQTLLNRHFTHCCTCISPSLFVRTL
jgi:hypothetical protein